MSILLNKKYEDLTLEEKENIVKYSYLLERTGSWGRLHPNYRHYFRRKAFVPISDAISNGYLDLKLVFNKRDNSVGGEHEHPYEFKLILSYSYGVLYLIISCFSLVILGFYFAKDFIFFKLKKRSNKPLYWN